MTINIQFVRSECWKDEPNERPSIQDVAEVLETINSPKQHFINDSIIEENNDNSIQESEFSSSSSEETLDFNKELDILNILNTIDFGSSSSPASVLSNIINSKINLSSVSIQTDFSRDSLE